MRPDRPISPQAMAIHRITEEMVADKPWIEEIIPHYHGSPWYVAHNASFDRRVLPEMHGEWICTMKLARRLWPGIKYSNMGLYKSRKLNVTTPPGLHHHRALYDCYITAALLLDIINVSGWTPDEMADITGRPALLTTFTFGKYRGKAVAEIAENDPVLSALVIQQSRPHEPRTAPDAQALPRGIAPTLPLFPAVSPCAGGDEKGVLQRHPFIAFEAPGFSAMSGIHIGAEQQQVIVGF